MGDPVDGGWLLEVVDAEKRYGTLQALRGASLSFRRGEYFCILGPSGCGKSTILRLVSGFEDPEVGDVRLEGKSLVGVPPEHRDVNMVFQSYALFPHMTLRQNVEFGPRMKGWPEDRVTASAARMLEVVQLGDRADRYPEQLSGGQRQRVALARALVNEPKLLLLDEPLAALDKNLKSAMQKELRRLQRESGTTFVHVTHDQEEALVLSDRLAIMNHGRVVQCGGPDEVYARPSTPFVAEFLGAANLVDARLDQDPSRIVVGDGLHLPAPKDLPKARGGDRIRLMIRPENLLVEVGPGREPRDDGATRFPARVKEVRRIGSDLEIEVEAGGLTLASRTTRIREIGELQPGSEVGVVLATDDLVVLGEDLPA